MRRFSASSLFSSISLFISSNLKEREKVEKTLHKEQGVKRNLQNQELAGITLETNFTTFKAFSNLYLSFVNGDGPANAAGLPTHFVTFAVHLKGNTQGVTMHLNVYTRTLWTHKH